METLHPQTIIALGVLISVLAVVFYALLYPVKENQARFEIELKELKTGQANLDKRMDSLEKRMDGIESKLDQLLAKS